MPVHCLEFLVVALGLAMLMLDAFVKFEDKRVIARTGMVGLGVVFLLLFRAEWPESTSSEIWRFYASEDSLSLFFKGIALLSTIFVLVMAVEYAPQIVAQTADPEKGAHPQSGLGEFYTLPVFACAGLMWMASANHLVSIFVSLEMVTITFYIMVAYLRRNVGSLEAGVKYLILGALSTGFLVYGFAWLFGVTGSMELAGIAEALAEPGVNRTSALFAFALIFVALVFKIGGAPFHFWIPDVYQGAPTPITAFLSVASKAAGFLVFLRLLSPFLGSEVLSGPVVTTLVVFAVLTLVIGNLAALPQRNFKRLLAYSSIAHVGFLLMAVASAPESGSGGRALLATPAGACAFYLGAYLLMTFLAFLVMSVCRGQIGNEDQIDSYTGLARRSPLLSFAMLVAMASLAGIPLTAGFFGKLFVFKLVIEQGQWLLLGVGLVGAATGFYYYLKIAASMYLSEPKAGAETAEPIRIALVPRIAIIALVIAILAVGVVPGLMSGLFS